jgi:signal transduction histidine kinase/DNA-binding response OmpR family regulator/streptogramin lyase
LPFEDINSFEEDRKGNLWIGTNGGGLLYFDRKTGKFKQYLNEPGNINSLSGNVIVSLCLDADDNLWIGTYKAGLNKFDGKKFTRFAHVPGDTTSLPSQNVWEIFEDSKKRLWIGTVDVGIALADQKTGKFHRLTQWGSIEEINEDRNGRIWFGTPFGIEVLSEDGKTFLHYGYSSEPNSLSSNSVLDILRDAKGRMWIGTSDGLNLFDESINGFRTFKENRVNNAVLTVEEDNFGNIWTASFNGISKMTLMNGSLDSVSFKHYTESDGLQGRQFNMNASLKTKSGELVFGGHTGFNITNGTEHREDLVVNKIVFSELELYEKPVAIGEKIDGVVVLNQAISEADEIVLPPDKNFFSLKFSALNYFNPERDQFAYMLDGLKTGWLPVDAQNPEIVFNSLNPGRYRLRLRAANSDGAWSDKEAVLSIVILPPFWKTKTAFVLYTVLLMAILFVARRIIQQREKLKYTLEHERQEMQRVHELDMMKVKFFTNVSHEFRTPLTLILTPIERLLKKTSDPEQLVLFQLIHRNGRRLMNLVNQLLDFKRLEVQETKFNPTNGDVVAFIKDTVSAFSDLSEKKNIKLAFHSTADRLEMLFDHDKLEKIMFNLLGNAFKFTLENGVVSVKVDQTHEGNERFVQIEVSDTGIGIPQNKLEKIFEPFFQTDIPKNIVNQGSGIGLAITKEFVRIHGGRIEINSEVGRGSAFKVVLPLREMPVEQNETRLEQVGIATDEGSESSVPNSIIAPETQEQQGVSGKKKSLLLIEDNDDFRFYLRDNLKFLYTIYEASNGADGWNLALSVQPDLIVSDIMMPVMNGIELCTKIKSDERVSHIPVILLTARSSEEQRIEGFKTGADDYITKPFNFEVLEARINNLLKQREKFQKTFRKTLDIKSSELQITPLDVKFIEKAVKVVEANISSPDFSIEDLGMELGISRAYVFKKILALTGKTPLEFMRTIRLQHAAQLLEKSQLSVREVAYKVGFNNPKYFTKYFKEHYNILPSDFAASKKNEGE